MKYLRYSTLVLAICLMSFCFAQQTVDTSTQLPKRALNASEVARSQAIADKIWSMDQKLGLSKSDLYKVCLRIERIDHSSSKRLVHPKRRTGLPCKISKEPHLNGYLISDLPHGYMDRGCHKIVSKAILYSDEPKILASCIGTRKAMAEVKIMRKLGRCRGTAAFLGVANRPRDKLEIWLESYSEGSLLRKRISGQQFSREQKLKIFKDISYGLRALHQHKFVHRDLHFGNMLLRKSARGQFDAALIDFGQASHPKDAGKRVPQIPGHLNPPELLVQPLKKIDRYAADVYALGVSFYSFLSGEDLPWVCLSNPKETRHCSRAAKKRRYQSIVAEYEPVRRRYQTSPTAQPYEKALLLIVRMLDYNPARRPTMPEVVSTLERIAPD